MIFFWLVCAIFIAIALAFVLPPLLQSPDKNRRQEDGRREANIAVYRDQISELDRDLDNGIITPQQLQQDRDELERRLLEDVPISGGAESIKTPAASRRPAYVIALALPILAVSLYLRIGSPVSSSPPSAGPGQAATNGPPDSEQFSQQKIEANVTSLAKRLEQNPNDTNGWIMLARSYTSLEKYNEASAAYAKATMAKTDDAELWADYAFALAMANGKRLQGQPLELVNKALKLDPENPKALELAGSAAYETKNYKQAVAYWQRLLERTPADSELGQVLARRIAEAKTLPNGPVSR